MLIASWMTNDPISILPTTSLAKCQKLLKEHHIRRLPVVDEKNRVVGMISDKDVRSASPSKATALEAHEMQYLLAEVKAKDFMTANPVTVVRNDTVSHAALLMLEHKFGGLPVVDEEHHLIGIITEHDIFSVLVSISGARIEGIDLTIQVPEKTGSLGAIFEILRSKQARIISVMTAYMENGMRQVFIRLHNLSSPEHEALLKKELEKSVAILEWTNTQGSKELQK